MDPKKGCCDFDCSYSFSNSTAEWYSKLMLKREYFLYKTLNRKQNKLRKQKKIDGDDSKEKATGKNLSTHDMWNKEFPKIIKELVTS